MSVYCKSLCKVEDEEEKFVHTQGHDQVPEGHMFILYWHCC